MNTRDILQMALDALESVNREMGLVDVERTALEALRAHLSAPEPEPVAWIKVKDLETLDKYDALVTKHHVAVQRPLYTKDQI